MKTCHGARLAILAAVSLLAVTPAAGQALDVATLANGTELVHVTLPLAEATSVGWPVPAPGTQPRVASMAAGALTLVADLEEVLSGDQAWPAPAVVVAIGGGSSTELRGLLGRLLTTAPEPPPEVLAVAMVEGRIERHLGSAGSEAVLRLEVALPAPESWQRSPVEVLWEMLPEVVGDELPGVRSRVDGDRGALEARVDPDLAELKLGRLRLALARIGSQPSLEADRVEAVRRRLAVRRRALLESHPEAAELLVRLWLRGGAAAVREYLFGLEGVTTHEVSRAAREWLPQHPGLAVLRLPPRVFSPRFAPAPRRVQLDNDLAAAVLERPGSALAAVCLRPVLSPDVDGGVTATVLARLASELRSLAGAPGWVRVRTDPAMLELAVPIDGFAEMCETLQVALGRVAEDRRGVDLQGGDARRRALQMVAGHLGLAEQELSPSDLLSPRNVALGVVAADGEAAEDALRKFLVGWSAVEEGAGRRPIASGQRTREAAPGDESVLIVVLPLGRGLGGVENRIITEGLRQRCSEYLAEVGVELLRPLVPGRRVLLLVLRAQGELEALEELVAEAWPRLVTAIPEAELAPIRRRVAARYATEASGALGRARCAAAVATGEVQWRSPTEMELQILSVAAEDVTLALEQWEAYGGLQTYGAGVLPITAVEP